MSEKPSEPYNAPAEPEQAAGPAGVEPGSGDAGTGDFTTEVDPTFVPDESDETPEEKRAREHPEATGS
ncbi:hypothetical protein AAHB33_05265 [Paenarthrobacter sp. S56]|uniref:hypothetical protein n=1 Tax=Paenarthrobacter sp. S56 TaxID=3138179 RepID=UPI00321B3394